MNINRAGKQQKAYWRSEEYWNEKWMKEDPITDHDKQYGRYQIAMQRQQGFATGWIAGVAWAKRQKRK